MSRLIAKNCERCGALNEFDLDELRGMPLRAENGIIIEEHPTIELDKPIHVECDSCHGPFIVTEDDIQ